MRGLRIMLVLAALPIVPGVQAQDEGCTPCECGVAICQGDDMWFPLIRADASPIGVVGLAVSVDVEVGLEPADDAPPAPSEPVWGGQTQIQVRGPSGFERVDGPDLVSFPSGFEVGFTPGAVGTYSLIVEVLQPHVRSEAFEVKVVPQSTAVVVSVGAVAFVGAIATGVVLALRRRT